MVHTPLTPDAIHALRTQFALNQAQFASLLGVVDMTVSRWERGVSAPNDYQRGMLARFATVPNKVVVGAEVGDALATDGVFRAVYLMLKAAFMEAQNG